MSGAELLLYGLIFVGVLVLVEGLYLTIFGRSITFNNRINERLSRLNRRAEEDAVLAQLRKEIAQNAPEAASGFRGHLAALSSRGGLKVSPNQVILIMAGLVAFITLILGSLTILGWIASFGVALIIGIAAPYAWLYSMMRQRLSKLEEQLPDAVELMVRSLRVGHPFSAALAIVAEEVQEPLSTEFAVISDEAVYGRDVAQAIMALAERLDMQDLRFLAVAISIQQQSGGNLSEILDGLAKMIRSRFRLFRRVKAITAEAKWSGMFLSIFPVIGLVGITLFRPDYYQQVQQDGLFGYGLVIVTAFMLVNFLVMRMLVNVKV